MKKILAENGTEEKVKTNLYSKLSLMFSAFTLTLFLLLLNSIPSSIKASEGLPVIPQPLITATVISCFLGVIFSIVCLVKKESSKYLKVISALLSFTFFIILVATIGFALLMDSNSPLR